MSQWLLSLLAEHDNGGLEDYNAPEDNHAVIDDYDGGSYDGGDWNDDAMPDAPAASTSRADVKAEPGSEPPRQPALNAELHQPEVVGAAQEAAEQPVAPTPQPVRAARLVRSSLHYSWVNSSLLESPHFPHFVGVNT